MGHIETCLCRIKSLVPEILLLRCYEGVKPLAVGWSQEWGLVVRLIGLPMSAPTVRLMECQRPKFRAATPSEKGSVS